MALPRITLDFDGSVQSTTRRAQGTAVGYNRKKKGARSYYPLFCTVAQTGQVLDFHHRPGNVHDSRGAREFILKCVALARQHCPHTVIEIRMDSAFFSDEIVHELHAMDVEFSISVPFERLPALKQKVEARRRWKSCGGGMSSFELQWKPEKWSSSFNVSAFQAFNDLDLVSEEANDRAYSASANLKFTPSKVLMFGVEFMHGYRALANNDIDGSFNRIQFSAKYSFGYNNSVTNEKR